MAKIEVIALVVHLIHLAAGLYFPQSDLALRIPYVSKNGIGKIPSISLFSVRSLKNDSTLAEDVKYEISSIKDKFAIFNDRNKNVILHSLPKDGNPTTIIVQAKDSSGTEAFFEIKIIPQLSKDNRINCSEYIEDMCFWNRSKYRIYENQPVTLLGSLGSDAYKRICPKFFITGYELLNGTEFFHLLDNKLYSNESLDRDTLNPPKGIGPSAHINVRCVIWEENTGIQYTIERVLSIDILDQNDNPPISQTSEIVEIQLKDFVQGDRLDEKDLLINDADDINTNSYSVTLLDDVYNILNLTYDIIPIDNPKRPDYPPYTTIFAKLFARTKILPKSPYRVILQVKDESLLPGYGNSVVNITLALTERSQQQQQQPAAVASVRPTAPSVLARQQVSYPALVEMSRESGRYYRVAQPLQRASGSKVAFNLRGPDAFNVTRSAGIVYVANPTALLSISTAISLRVEWRAPGQDLAFATLTIKVQDGAEPCKQPLTGVHSCATAKTGAECEGRCGVAAAGGARCLPAPVSRRRPRACLSYPLPPSRRTTDSDARAAGCAWRPSQANSSAMTEKYETCSPDLATCPDNACDELEQLDPRICPQDCVIESEVRFAEVNQDGRGIRSGLGACWCDDYMQCTCGSSFRKQLGKEPRETSRTRKPQSVASDAPKAAGSTCGPTCLIGIVAASLFVVVIIVGSFVLWRYRIVTKIPRRNCKHRGSEAANGLGILPLDCVDRGDGLLIGLESLAATNRALLSTKTTSPDPKWEFPRSRLTIEQVLGEGEFGRVLRAKAKDIEPTLGLTTVAVKTLKEDASASELADLLSEYQLLKEAQHPNVIRLLGACTSAGGPIYLIIEFAEFGSLRNYLRRSRHLEGEGKGPCFALPPPSSPSDAKSTLDETRCDATADSSVAPRDILSFAWQISKGMAYLADIKLVHRDLAARNVLLAAGKVCKISDFGLTRDVYEDDAYLKRSKGRVPVKWMAPESLADHVYTSKSDVWSFGVLLWELVTLGASPYPGVDVHNLYSLLRAGYRMEKPANCSPQLYKLMVSCWHDEPGMRPSFKELTCHWERMLEDAVEYLDLNPRTVHNQAYFATLHALDSPDTSGESQQDVLGCALVRPPTNRASAVNYLSKPPFEPINKCDKVDKLEALWHEPSCSSRAYVNESASMAYQEHLQHRRRGHYESPIKLRNASLTSNSENELATGEASAGARPQSYIDMQAGSASKILSKESDDLLMSFNSLDTNADFERMSDFE
ncbi:uncharacterized protein LOC131673446 isoform X2 [Phymastichus coffea]|uniref:uncharacterized protein LOC131673446 isoform X2 n=1 Tax=Phymastichus coffea TaxID=108790 RepID=UPI00273B7765|nr:uncharacterized protein LOC131673446 isoform X2 [Phymastichus coffea]